MDKQTPQVSSYLKRFPFFFINFSFNSFSSSIFQFLFTAEKKFHGEIKFESFILFPSFSVFICGQLWYWFMLNYLCCRQKYLVCLHTFSAFPALFFYLFNNIKLEMKCWRKIKIFLNYNLNFIFFLGNTWFERISMLVILLNCITLGMYQPCVDEHCETNRCKILQVSHSRKFNKKHMLFIQ